jgi:hypothetical protein
LLALRLLPGERTTVGSVLAFGLLFIAAFLGLHALLTGEAPRSWCVVARVLGFAVLLPILMALLTEAWTRRQ